MKSTKEQSQSVTESRTTSKAVPTPSFAKHKDQDTEQQKPETMQQLQDRLRDCFIQYKETAQRCQVQFKSKASNEQFSRLYYSPNVPFFEEPEKQKIFRKEFVQDVAKLPEPKPIVTIADVLHADWVETIGDNSNPQATKDEMIMFYTRRSAQLQHRKHKLIKRWANTYSQSEQIDQISSVFDRELAQLQIEQDSVASRLMRLQPDDRYSQDNQNERPKPTSAGNEKDEVSEASKLYKEAEQQCNDSALRQDDFEVYFRHTSYLNSVNRPAKKLIQSFKWLSFEKRYEIWSDSRLMMHAYQKTYLDKRFNLMFIVANEVKRKLADIGIIDEKGISACTERYVYQLKDNFTTRTQQLLNSQKFNHFEPFMLFSGKAELKHYLVEIAKEYGLNCSQLDLDQGQMFTYQLQTFFPSKFEKQVRAMTFDWEDTGANPDMQMVERLTRSLGLNKDQLLSDMSKHSAEQRTQSLLNALNVGKTGAIDMTLKDLTENELNRDQFTRHNLLRKLRQIEFFSLEESEVKMRRADWLEYVCWQPQVSVHVQRQNQHLSSSQNRIDNLLKSAMEFTDVNDSVIVNKIIEDSIKVHIQKINDVQKKISQCMGASEHMKGSEVNTDGAIRSLIEATNPCIAREMVKETDPNLTEAQQIQFNKFQDIPNVDPLTLNLTKAFYTLRVIKTRDTKIQLLSVINYFRAVQRILALDVREFMTREKAYGDHLDIIDPHFGNNSKGQSILKTQTPAGPSEIFNTTVEREMDQNPVKGKDLNMDPITYKAYKLKQSFEPIAISTCPIVPKHHRTFGRPSLQERVSTESEKERIPEINFNRMKSLLTMRDRLHVDYETKEIYVTNEYGMRIVYYEALNDLTELEEELTKIGSYYINKYEFVIQNNEVMDSPLFDQNRPTSLIDRPQMAIDLLEKEYQYQFSKVKLIEQHMEVYEHTYDPLESVRILQVIADLIVSRPRLNMEASMYCESYMAETEALMERQELMGEFMQMQKVHEQKENEVVHSFIESKIRKFQENVDQYWVQERERDKVRRVGSFENKNQNDLDQNKDNNVDELLRQKIQQTEKQEAMRQEQLAKIKQRHITEFANEQFSDFASVLGLPQVTMEQLYLRFDESEPIVIDALRESAFFQKMVEGYPLKLELPNESFASMGQHTPDCNLTEFFESYQVVSKFNASLEQAFADLEKETTPENGFAVTCIQVCMLKKARLVLRQRKQIMADGGKDPDHLKGQDLFEEDFYLGNCDKLVYQMKMLHVESNETNLYQSSNPLVMSKLDTQSVSNFNFPRIKGKEVVEALQRDGDDDMVISEHLTSKVIQMAKESVARPNLSYLDNNDKEEKNTENVEQVELRVRVPSMLKMFCNIVEVHRLREEIIMRMNESTVLGRIYEHQCSLAGKQSKFSLGEQVSFNTNQVNLDCMNIVDLNDGTNLVFSPALPFMEYDKSLSANLDFKSDSCIKVLFTELGVEEMRAILHLQIAHQQLLTVAVRTNQILIDKPVKGLQELELLEKKEITTPNSVIDLMSILGGHSDSTNFGNIKSERSRMRQYLTKSISDQFYMLLPKKQRERQVLTKRFGQVTTKLMNSDAVMKPELILRILRSYRLQLCYGYCTSMVQEAQKDSVKIQILETCNALRTRATLLPNKSQIFRLGKSDTQENLSFEANCQLRKLREFTSTESAEMTIQSLLQGQGLCTQNSTLFYIPSAEEVCMADRSREANRVLKDHTQDHVQSTTIDSVIKTLVKKQNVLATPVYKLEGKQVYGVRKVWMEESPNLQQYDTFLILIYCTQILNIFDLEYTMLRNLSKSWQSQALESKALSGRPFWSNIDVKKQKIDQRALKEHMNNDALVENKTSLKVIQHLDNRKKAWIDLEEDCEQVANKLRVIEKECQNLPSEKRTLPYLCDLLTLQHQSTYFAFLNGVENMIEYYLDKNHDEYFYKLLQVKDQLTNKNIHSVNLIRSNGYYIQQAQIAPNLINLAASSTQEFNSFKQSYQPVIDERCLIPRQVTLLKSLYGQQSYQEQRDTKFGYPDILQSAFYNMEDDSRALMGANFTQVDEYIDDYLIFKGLKDAPNETANKMIKGKDHFLELLLSKVEILSFKIEAASLERVIMCWEQHNSKLPITTRKFQQVQRKFRDSHTMAILHERDTLNDQYWYKQKKQNQVAAGSSKVEREKELLSGLQTQRQNKQAYFSKVNQLRAETIVIKSILEVNLIKIAIDMVRNEHSALQACFEASGQDKQISVFVHPSQQFASTPYSKVDKAPHLDVVTKVGFLQQFLTRLRNRCTEVETLTSGPGLVFSMKDFNDCISLFARQLIKYGEEELRGRSETANLKQYQYHHVIYIKQMESLYYRKKCEQLLQNIETLTNAKMLSQGNQMIYELDCGARELQTLKDHYYVMESCIRDEIRNEFRNEIQEKGALISKQKNDFQQFRKEINIDLSEQVAKEISTLDHKFKQQNNMRLINQMNGQKTQRVEAEAKDTDPELISEILQLTKFVRKQRIFFQLKTLIKQERHENEMALQKDKLSQNQSLWESLAEAEKREQITQQELVITKNNLIHYERLIEKLYSQLEHLNNQKLRLEQYKKNRSKQISELESKMQDLEILESLDLNKILKELNERKSKIEVLEKVDSNFDSRLEQISSQHKHQMDELKKLVATERSAKLEAFDKLDIMRVEMKTLEGKDSVKNDLWKDKCKELYDICRELEIENDSLKSACKDLQTQITQNKYEVQSNTLQNSTSDQSTFQPLTREQIILQRKKYAGKPQTANTDNGGRRGFAGKISSQPNVRNQGNVVESAVVLDSLKISVEGFGDRRGLNTLRTHESGGRQYPPTNKAAATASQSSHQGETTQMRVSYGPNHFQTVNQSQKSAAVFQQVSSMPHIRGLHKHNPIAMPASQQIQGPLMIDSGTLRVKK